MLREMLLPVMQAAVAIWLIAFAGPQVAHAQQQSQLTLSAAEQKQVKALDHPIVLRGDYFRAVESAYSDFAKYLTLKKTGAAPQDKDNQKLVDWLSNIENYDIHVRQLPTSYTVMFEVTLRNNAPPVFGGGASYLIDGSSFQIIRKTFSK
jgi:hypothetical protein